LLSSSILTLRHVQVRQPHASVVAAVAYAQ
jgi:hypothetical protein